MERGLREVFQDLRTHDQIEKVIFVGKSVAFYVADFDFFTLYRLMTR